MSQRKWDVRFLDVASLIATWSKDPSTKVGAIIVDAHRRIVSAGYNGAPRGVAEPNWSNREVKLQRTIHAEANALHFAGDVTGCTLYVTNPCCAHCAGHIIQRGIKRVVFIKTDLSSKEYQQRWADSLLIATDMFAEAGVEFEGINPW